MPYTQTLQIPLSEEKDEKPDNICLPPIMKESQ